MAASPASQSFTWAAALTPLIGREQELPALIEKLEQSRLVTLTGPGGCGKTRLALELAATQQARFAAGVWRVSFVACRDPDLVPAYVTAALGIPEQPGESVLTSLRAALGADHAMLLLDTCEHVITASAQLCSVLLAECPRLTILTTSREALNIPGEVVWPVTPLALPEPVSEPTPEHLWRYGAIRLFVTRARTAQPGFDLTTENAASVATICRLVDGLPLALELAAARLRIFGIDQLAAQLHDSLDSLAGGNRLAPPHQQTLTATLAWSYALLTPAEQRLFRELAVFTGAFDMAMVEAVANAPAEAVATVAWLADKSLIVVEHGPRVARYRFLTPVRQYAARQLAGEAEADATYTRYCAWVERFIDEATPHVYGGEQSEWLQRIEDNHDHLRAGLRWLTEHDQTARALGLGVKLFDFWRQRGHVAEGRRWLEALLAQSQDAPDDTRAQGLSAIGALATWQWDIPAAEAALAAAHTLFSALDEPHGLARNQQRQGALAAQHGDCGTATSHFTASLRLAQAIGDDWLGALNLSRLGTLALEQGDIAQAEAYYRECLELRRALQDSAGIAGMLNNLGLIAGERGDDAQARQYFQESAAQYSQLGDKATLISPLLNHATLALRQGDYQNALASLREALAAARQSGALVDQIMILEGFALLARHIGQGELAARLWGACQTQRRALHVTRKPTDSADYAAELAHTRALLDDQTFTAEFQAGEALTVAAAFDVAEQLCLGQSGPQIAISPTPELRIHALGAARVERDGALLTAADGLYAKPRELLIYLCEQAHRTKEQIGLALWPDASTEQLRANFHVAIYQLRHALGRADWALYANKTYALNRALPLWYDVAAFEALADAGRRLATAVPAQATQQLEDAVALYHNDFLDGMDGGDWVMLRRHELRQRYLDTLYLLGQLWLQQDDPARALTAFQRTIAVDAFHEGAQRGVMECLVRLNEPAQAIQRYRAFRQLLHDELGGQPSRQTTALISALLRERGTPSAPS